MSTPARFTDLRDFVQATLELFAAISDNTPIRGALDTPYGGCAIGQHLTPDQKASCRDTDEAAQLLVPTPLVTGWHETIWDIVGMHDSAITVGNFKHRLRYWLAAHPYQVEFPLVPVSEQHITILQEVPHG